MADGQRSGTNKVFIDASVLIAAAISATGSARDLLMYGIRHELPLAVSNHVFEETERNLERKAPQALPAFLLFRDVLPFELVHPPAAFVREVAEVIEEKDAAIVAGALHAQATFLATYDRKHLLQYHDEIKERFEVVVATPAPFFPKALQAQTK